MFVAYLAALAQNSPVISDAQALEVARQVGTRMGYRPGTGHVEYEVTDGPHNPEYAGFRTVQVRNGLQTAYDLSVELKSGRVFDFAHCLVFDFPPRKRLIRARSATLESYRKVLGRNGCDDYRILRRLGDDTGAPLITVP